MKGKASKVREIQLEKCSRYEEVVAVDIRKVITGQEISRYFGIAMTSSRDLMYIAWTWV